MNTHFVRVQAIPNETGSAVLRCFLIKDTVKGAWIETNTMIYSCRGIVVMCTFSWKVQKLCWPSLVFIIYRLESCHSYKKAIKCACVFRWVCPQLDAIEGCIKSQCKYAYYEPCKKCGSPSFECDGFVSMKSLFNVHLQKSYLSNSQILRQ